MKKAINNGNLGNVDLKIKDVTSEEIETLPKDITVSNFGKLNGNSSKNDIILGALNMIFETIGMMAAFALKNEKTKDAVIIGNIVTIPTVRCILDKIEKIQNISFIIPKDAQYAIAIGAIRKASIS